MRVEIRLATPADLPAVQRVARAAWYGAHRLTVGEQAGEHVGQTAREYERKL